MRIFDLGWAYDILEHEGFLCDIIRRNDQQIYSWQDKNRITTGYNEK